MNMRDLILAHAPRQQMAQAIASLCRTDAVAFWDRSADRRGACNSAFIVRGELTFEQVIRAARQAWPKVWARFTFPVIEVDVCGQEVRT